MPNLVGIGNSQVPTNAMLGGLAYQDPAHANLTEVEIENIAAIKTKTADTATDVFVYDTRKDSDGGAWRKRTQDTSWYNEGIGPYRGHRKEFPAVAVIVASSSALTIYDADDSNCSMWMVIVKDNAKWLKHSTSGPNSVVALNGNVVSCGAGDQGRLSVINFVSDNGYVTETSYTYRHNWIATRNSTGVGPNDTLNPRHILNIDCKDVAITVLPNAPIDESTGLPIPTIAVATTAGLSIIKDDGIVVDKAVTNGDTDVGNLDFTNDGNLLVTRNNYNYVVITKLIGDESVSYPSQYTSNINYFRAGGTHNPPPHSPAGSSEISGYNFANLVKSMRGTDLALADTYGLSIFSVDRDLPSASNLVTYITKDYNTGWMVGNTKGAWLASTDTTNITGTGDGLVTGNDSTFGDTISNLNWSERSGSSGGWNVSGGVLKTGSVSSGEYLDITLSSYTSGQKHLISYTLSNVTGSNPLRWRYNNGQMGDLPTSNGTHYYYVTLTESGTLFSLLNDASMSCDIDNFRIQRVSDDDHSTNGKGLVAYGTVTKTQVATDSDLVYYTGFNGSNLLRQEYNSDLNFGTNDFSIFVWVKKDTLSTNHYIIDRSITYPSWGAGTGRAYFIIRDTGYHRFKLPGGSEVSGTVKAMPTGIFNHVGFVRRNGTMEFWLNGEHTETITGTNASTSFDGGVTGQSVTVNRYANGFAVDYTFDAMALLRISATAPTPEQVEKMYNDEKVLFQPNAKCTFYGSSDAVTGLDYDDSNDTLHIGTSSGRSDFCGLNRINNTTTAVTTAISASNGLVAEQ